MVADDPNGFVGFDNVRVIRSTAPAVEFRIGERSIWLPRIHIRGTFWGRGDHGKLLLRRWVARDRRLIGPDGAITVAVRSVSRSARSAGLHLVRAVRTVQHAG